MCVPLCGRFGPDEGGVAGYVDRIGTKYAAKWGVQMAGMNFQTDPSICDTTGRSLPATMMASTHSTPSGNMVGRH